MSDLRKAVGEYLRLRRAFGFKMRGVDGPLYSFVAFVEKAGRSYITTDLSLRWAQLSTDVQPAAWRARLEKVRGFALWRSSVDPRTQVPAPGLLPYRYHRRPPYVYRDSEIRKIISAAYQISSAKGLKGPTYATLFGLLAVTGMRGCEALALDRTDVNLEQGMLYVRQTKFGKSRLVPLHHSTCTALSRYADLRDRILQNPASPAFFASDDGARITSGGIKYYFGKMVCEARIGTPVKRPGRRSPALHGLRHSFAARTLLDWYRAGLDVEREIPKLATYLGHAHISGTYWYLEAVPELLQFATRRLSQVQKEVRR